jgi:hypothetical protein
VRSLSAVAPACSAFLIVIAFMTPSSAPYALQTRDEPILSRTASWVAPNIAMALVEEDLHRRSWTNSGSPDRAKMNPVRLWIFQSTHTWKASPMTYMFDGTQYGAVAAGSNIIALAIQD